jgi:signal peptidase I
VKAPRSKIQDPNKHQTTKLQNWRIGDASGQSGPMPNFILQPDSFVIVCTGSAVAAMQVYGRVISVTSFPSLDNDGDQLYLKSNTGLTIHAVSYSLSWYQNAVKSDGGWTLEMIDTKNPCSGISNWKASTDARGGSPGIKNSVDAVNNDQSAPSIKSAYAIDNLNIVIVFDEPVDSLKGATAANYSIDGGLSIQSATSISPLFDKVQLRLATAMQANIVYTVTVNNVTDCKNNSIGSKNKAKIGLPVDAVVMEMVINEILFNPKSGVSDYVEFYNRSNKIFDANKLYIANRNSSGAISSAKLISTIPYYIFPGDYIVATEDAVNLPLNYMVQNPDAVFVVSSMPSFPDDKGDVILLNLQGAVVDGIGNALYGGLTHKDGAAEQNNFHRYRMIRMHEAPKKIDVHFVQNDIDPTGLGEAPFPPVFGAVANALYKNTGNRFYEQPFILQLNKNSKA